MTEAKAQALARLGLHVFPVREKDSVVNGVAKKIKSPYTRDGFQSGTTDPRKIERMWQAVPDAWVGVWCGPSGIIVADIDEHDGSKDGRVTLVENNIDELTTYNYGTRSGHGRHYIYEGAGEIPNGHPFGSGQGVDRQSGDSYVIWYGPVPSSRDEFQRVPGWLLENATSKQKLESVDIKELFDELDDDEPMSAGMKAAYDRVPTGEFGRNDLYRRGVEIGARHYEGGTGAKKALKHLMHEWLRGEYNTPEYQEDMLNTLGNAFAYAKYQAPTELMKPAREVTTETRVLSYGELMETEYAPKWLMQDLMPSNGLALITGHAGIGKSTLALQMAATFAAGGDQFLLWKVADVRKRKVLFLSLELEGWGLQQFMSPLSKSFPVKDLNENLLAYPLGAPMILTDEPGQKALMDLISEWEPDILFIDSLGETTRNLQDEEQSAQLFDFFKRVKNENIAIFIIHHHRKVTAENAGKNRRLNDMSDVYGSYNVTKQPDLILDVDERRDPSDGKGTAVEKGTLAIDTLKIRYAQKLSKPVNLERDINKHITLEGDIDAAAEDFGNGIANGLSIE
jgi:archaellum biogenesis ATPase FlaH